jgi:hypothetical protein
MPSAKIAARFIPPMLLLRKERLPEGSEWLYELKLDGYRALAIKRGGKARREKFASTISWPAGTARPFSRPRTAHQDILA